MRQQDLDNSIGVLPEEHEAYKTLLIMACACIPGLFIATILQFLAYFVFNKYFHPFKDIISPSEKESERKSYEMKNLSD